MPAGQGSPRSTQPSGPAGCEDGVEAPSRATHPAPGPWPYLLEHPNGNQQTPQGPHQTEEMLAEAAWFEQLEGELVVKGRKLAVRRANKVREGPPGQPGGGWGAETAKATRALNKQILPRQTERETEVSVWATAVPRARF